MASLLDDFKSTKRELKRIYALVNDEFADIEEETSVQTK